MGTAQLMWKMVIVFAGACFKPALGSGVGFSESK